jgi:N,N'-diacetylbacillosaminyl-diphospho-undecaprenol alpha-1,3-N-acetylgalactosaminyltransferase
MIQKRIIKEEKVKIIKSVGVDTEKFDIKKYDLAFLKKYKKDLDLENKIVVLMVSRAIWDKGIKEYMESAKILKSKYKDIEFLLVGDTDEGNHSCASRDILENSDIKWLGHRDDIAELTAICDIYVLPSYREGLPATLMEASSMSKPIVTTDSVGCREVVDDGVNGFLVPVRDINRLCDKIELLYEDRELRERFGKNSRKKALDEFDIKKIVAKYIKYYKSFLNERDF